MRCFSILAAFGAMLLVVAPVQADEAGFAGWLTQYRQDAVRRGLPAEWVDKALADAVYTPRVVELDRAQPDDSGRRNVFASYLNRQLTPRRIADGRARASTHSGELQRISADTGVPGAIIVAIWGMETSYGRITGGFDLPSSLATLAYDGRRAELFTRELDALVRMVGEGRMDRSQLRGSWAGAFGQPQFLPSSYLAYAKDGDGDGRIDIRNSIPDTFASIANYLQEHGWRRDMPWGFRAVVPRGFDRTSIANPEKPESCIRPMQAHSRWRPAKDWRADGFIPMNALWPADEVPMTLVEPDGPDTGAYLTTASYRAIMEYNCSNFYALSVALLADAVQSSLRN